MTQKRLSVTLLAAVGVLVLLAGALVWHLSRGGEKQIVVTAEEVVDVGEQFAPTPLPPPAAGNLKPTMNRASVAPMALLKKLKSPLSKPQFVMSMAAGRAGRAWIGTEEQGVFEYDPAGDQLRQFTAADGLGDDDVYAIAVDTAGRVWAGQRRSGVSVYNGRRWQNYGPVQTAGATGGVLAGPLGERVFDIAISPADGAVWMATNAGLARYSAPGGDDGAGTWRYYGRSQGMASEQVQCLALDAQGRLYAGTQSSGILMADASSDYRLWRQITGPVRPPCEAEGEPLAGNYINDIAVLEDGAIYAATTTGLAWSSDRGEHWQFRRGVDWYAKANGMAGGPEVELTIDDLRRPGLLAEDYITSVVDAGGGLMWLGYRSKGCALVDRESLAAVPAPGTGGEQYVTSMVRLASGKLMAGTYGDGGVITCGEAVQGQQAAVDASAEELTLPRGAEPLADEQMLKLRDRIAAIPALEDDGRPVVEPLADDWRTQGDWLGRYGRYWVTTTAMDRDYLWGVGKEPVGYLPRIGPHCSEGDSMRFWIQWASTDQKRCMEMPPVYLHSRVLRGEADFEKNYRRQAEHDDHGEGYPMDHEGPNLYYSLSIPRGVFVLSLYNTNKDGHAGKNRYRDYGYSVRPFVGDASRLYTTDVERISSRQRAPLVSLDDFYDRPELANGRLRDFWHGAYKRFVVRGPCALTVEVARNWSYNAINAGVFLDEVTNEFPDAYYGESTHGDFNGESAPTALLSAMNELAKRNPREWSREHGAYVQVVRSAKADGSAMDGLAVASAAYHAWEFELWEEALTRAGLRTSREIEKSLRWDQKTFACTGKGREWVTRYLRTAEQDAR